MRSVIEADPPVVAIPLVESDREIVRFVMEDPEMSPVPGSVQNALDRAGTWSGLDWNETIETLDRIRHDSRPTPPIESSDWQISLFASHIID